jgi:UDP-N-acetylglucosamine/UDP-N-acetylgalactosamine diphosphorylase
MGDLVKELEKAGQSHLLKFAGELPEKQRQSLIEQVNGIDFDQLKELHRQSFDKPLEVDPSKIEPMEALSVTRCDSERELRARAVAVGLEALLGGRVAVVLVAGGQGSRLGFEHPKGMFPIGPVTHASLFQIHAEKILARGRQSGHSIPWYIMTSPTNDAETRAYFVSNKYFGLAPEQVMFFVQGTMPAVDIETGKVLLAEKGEVFASPNGHGGTLLAMRDQGVLADMAKRGCDLAFYFQVDNPFVDILDPGFIGYHIIQQADVSLKVIRKAYPAEKLGLVIRYDGTPTVIEYSDLPDEIAKQVDNDGNLLYWTGSIAIHVFRREFLERITGADVGLPYHFARKKVAFIDESGQRVEPKSPNAIKFETFIFDCLPLAARVAVVETGRTEEYEPVKNAEGDHSPDVVRSAIGRKVSRWLQHAGISVPVDAAGEPAFPLEISPLVGLSPDDFARKVKDKSPVTGPTAWTEKGRVSGKG